MQLITVHPARVTERIPALDLVSRGRVEFGVGKSVCAASPTAGRPQWGREPIPPFRRDARRCRRLKPVDGASARLAFAVAVL